MKDEPRLLRAKTDASRLLESRGIDDPSDVAIEDIAMSLEIEVVEGGLKGAEARLTRRLRRSRGELLGRIRVREGIGVGERRFAIGHELGHFRLHESQSQLNTCLGSDIHGYAGSNEELEANAFSAELLIPRALIRKRYGNAERNLSLVSTVADDMLTSFSATAVRLIETSGDPYMVVFSNNGKVRWWRRSIKLSEVWLERRQPIDVDSLAWSASQGASPVARPVRIRPEAWFNHLEQCERLEVYEQSILLPSYDTVVTILSCLEHEGW